MILVILIKYKVKTMEIKNIQRRERKGKPITIRTYPSYCKWMSENNVSPTLLFNEALKELMKKGK